MKFEHPEVSVVNLAGEYHVYKYLTIQGIGTKIYKIDVGGWWTLDTPSKYVHMDEEELRDISALFAQYFAPNKRYGI